jgi:hypothetical protein
VHGDLIDFTPFGYLSNPSHRARAWGDTEGGNLRSASDYLGVEWAYPVGRDATSRAGIGLEAGSLRTRADFAAVGYRCHHHSSLVFGCEWKLDGVAVEAMFFLAGDDSLCARLTATNTAREPRDTKVALVPHLDGEPPGEYVLIGETSLDVTLAPGESRRVVALLSRGARVLGDVESAYQQRLTEDASFARLCPVLSGEWPAHWREGLHHDFQTTRLLVQPAGGIFNDVWPAWMAAWPRVVLAEGTLDMLRLAYADPSLAQRAVLSVFRDAPEANVPCIFRDGEYNMVAADGSSCGTSPAWCLPFLNLELLYLRTLDRAWLAEIYPLLSAYLKWWLDNRSDSEGWIVYKCTWESGEDGNPRLDPTGSGDADISGRARPVELQATVAHGAGVLAFFASELGLDDRRWRQVEADFRGRTQRLFYDGRYRDWLISEKRFQDECPDRLYWGIDPCRYSAQSLTPLLLGLELDEDEVWRHAAPPWTLWPSWTWSLVESAAARGLYAGIGELVFETIERVYRATTRRDISSFARPMPGSSPEFWPEDWRTYGGSDAYGWGATTANLLIRHLLGFKESRETDGWVAELTPAFPARMRRVGARYGVRNMTYRGVAFDLTYTVLDEGLVAHVDMGHAHHEFRVGFGQRYTLRLR